MSTAVGLIKCEMGMESYKDNEAKTHDSTILRGDVLSDDIVLSFFGVGGGVGLTRWRLDVACAFATDREDLPGRARESQT